MTLSDDLYRLAGRAKEAEQKAEQAQQKAAEDVRAAKIHLEKTVRDARASAEAQGTKLRESAQASQDKLSKWWNEQQEVWNEHLAKLRHDIDSKKAQHDVNRSERRAEDAEVDAEFAIDYAYAAIEEAEYSVLDAILARAEAADARSTA